MAELSLNDQELVRRNETEQLRQLGIDPFPAAEYVITHHTTEIAAGFDQQPDAYEKVRIAGRMMSKRDKGKVLFADLTDSAGSIQIYIGRDIIAPEEDKTAYQQFKKLISLGDIIGVEGKIFRTQTGELTLEVHAWTLLAKTLRPLPIRKEKDGQIYDGFTDQELRYRMRYVDLIVNPEVREVFVKRTKMFQSIRDFLNDRGYLEVETPILQPLYGGALARPFVTHHNTLDMTLYLRVANELYLKRLIVGGFDGVYEFAKDFRNEGMSRFHNPEFTQIEIYVAYKDYLWMANLVEEMIEATALKVNGSTEIQIGDKVINFKRPWARHTFHGAIEHFCGENVKEASRDELLAVARKVGAHVDGTEDETQLLDEIFGTVVEPKLIQPTFILDYPLEMSPLAKRHRTEAGLVERFEVVCNGKEIMNAYSELNDPDDQRSRFEEQARLREAGNDDAMTYDADFIRALEYGMPPTTGLGIGLDRMAMLLTGAASIQDVLFFPQLRPEPAEVQPRGYELRELGIENVWHPLLFRAGIVGREELAAANGQSLQQQIRTWIKQLNLETPTLSVALVNEWIERAAKRENV